LGDVCIFDYEGISLHDKFVLALAYPSVVYCVL